MTYDHDRCEWLNVSSGASSPGLSRTKSREPYNGGVCVLPSGFHFQHGVSYNSVYGNHSSNLHDFYNAMYYSAKCSLAIACRLSVCPSVTFVDHDHIG